MCPWRILIELVDLCDTEMGVSLVKPMLSFQDDERALSNSHSITACFFPFIGSPTRSCGRLGIGMGGEVRVWLSLAAFRRPAMALPKEFDREVGGVPSDPATVNGVDETDDEEDEVEVGELA